MHRIFSACLDIAASMVFIIPIFAICNKYVFHKMKHTVLYTIFAFYLIAVMSLVGLPNVKYIQIDFSINLIPFVDMVSDIKNALLNVLLFLPMGFFLPILWEKCRQIKHTLIICFCVTVGIELLQIFTFRTTDINDLITNTLGGFIGYLAAKWITKNFTKFTCSDTKHFEMYVIFALSLIVMIFGVPFISTLLWGLLL